MYRPLEPEWPILDYQPPQNGPSSRQNRGHVWALGMWVWGRVPLCCKHEWPARELSFSIVVHQFLCFFCTHEWHQTWPAGAFFPAEFLRSAGTGSLGLVYSSTLQLARRFSFGRPDTAASPRNALAVSPPLRVERCGGTAAELRSPAAWRLVVELPLRASVASVGGDRVHGAPSADRVRCGGGGRDLRQEVWQHCIWPVSSNYATFLLNLAGFIDEKADMLHIWKIQGYWLGRIGRYTSLNPCGIILGLASQHGSWPKGPPLRHLESNAVPPFDKRDITSIFHQRFLRGPPEIRAPLSISEASARKACTFVAVPETPSLLVGRVVASSQEWDALMSVLEGQPRPIMVAPRMGGTPRTSHRLGLASRSRRRRDVSSEGSRKKVRRGPCSGWWGNVGHMVRLLGCFGHGFPLKGAPVPVPVPNGTKSHLKKGPGDLQSSPVLCIHPSHISGLPPSGGQRRPPPPALRRWIQSFLASCSKTLHSLHGRRATEPCGRMWSICGPSSSVPGRCSPRKWEPHRGSGSGNGWMAVGTRTWARSPAPANPIKQHQIQYSRQPSGSCSDREAARTSRALLGLNTWGCSVFGCGRRTATMGLGRCRCFRAQALQMHVLWSDVEWVSASGLNTPVKMWGLTPIGMGPRSPIGMSSCPLEMRGSLRSFQYLRHPWWMDTSSKHLWLWGPNTSTLRSPNQSTCALRRAVRGLAVAGSEGLPLGAWTFNLSFNLATNLYSEDSLRTGAALSFS